jgi:hypothetical protein
MVMIDEELEAAKAAQAVISTLSTSALNSNVVAALRSATSVARTVSQPTAPICLGREGTCTGPDRK